MECNVAREALSALLDGEATEVDPSELEQHLAVCHECQAWRESAHIVTRRVRLATAQPAPAPSAALLAAAVAARRSRWSLTSLTQARLGLVAVAVMQIALTVPQLILGSDHEAPIHVAHEMGSFDMALAVGFLAVAWQPLRARGMHVLVGAAALLLLATAFIDLLGGRTSPADETPHLLALAGWIIMYRVAALAPGSDDDAQRRSFPLPRRSPSVQLDAPSWQEAPRRRDIGAGAELPAYERRAAAR